MDFKQQGSVLLEKYLSDLESNPKSMESSYNYEATYAGMMDKVEKEILQF